MSVGLFGICCCGQAVAGRKVRAGVHWWAGFAPLLVRGQFNAARFATNVPAKFRTYRYTATVESESQGNTTETLEFTFDGNFGDLASARFERQSEANSFNLSWERSQGYFQGFLNPGSAPWPQLVGGGLVLGHSPAQIGGVLWPFPTPVTVAESSVYGTQTKESGDTLTVEIELSNEVPLAGAAAAAAGVLERMDLLETPQPFLGVLDANYDWANDAPSQRQFDLVFESEFGARIALGRAPTNRVTLAYNRNLGDVLRVAGEAGFSRQSSTWPASVYGMQRGLPVQPSGGPWNSWDWPRPQDGVMALESLVYCPRGIHCGNHTSLAVLEFDYEVIWPWNPESGEPGAAYVGRGGPDPIPSRVEHFYISGRPGWPIGLRERLQLAGYELGESYVGDQPIPSGLAKPVGCG